MTHCQHNGNQSPIAVLSIVCLDDVPPVDIDWLWPGWIAAGKLHLMVGPPGVGKSFVTCDLSARITVGAAWPDGSAGPVPSHVLMISGEDNLADTVRPRLDAAGANVERVHAIQGKRIGADGGGLALQQVSLSCDIDTLDSLLTEMPDVRILIVDPLTQFLDVPDAHRDADVRQALGPLGRMAERHNVAVVCVTHFSKRLVGSALNRTMGSTGIVAASRNVWSFARDPIDTDRVLMLPTKTNIGRMPSGLAYRIAGDGQAARVEWESDPIDISADEATATEVTRRGPAPDRLNEAVSWLTTQLADGPVETAEIESRATRREISYDTLKRARKKLGVNSRHDKKSGRWQIYLS